MLLHFRGQNEEVLYLIDRGTKKLHVSSRNTKNVLKPFAWRYLFDTGKETVQERLTDKLTDTEFKFAIVMSMGQAGYSLVEDKK